MICYLDTTFCISPNCANDCGRKLTDEIREAAKRVNMPICTAYFCGLLPAFNDDENLPPNPEARDE